MDHARTAGGVLLVEDNSADLILTLRMFKKSGFANAIDVVRNGQEALDYLFSKGSYATRADYVPPSLVLLDLCLPRVSGHDVLQRIRAHPVTQHQPVVVLTTSGEDQAIVAGFATGAHAYVRKPVVFQAFVNASRSLGVVWLMLNELAPVLIKG